MHPVKTPSDLEVVCCSVQQTVVSRESSAPPQGSEAHVAELGPDDLVIQNRPQTPRNVDVERAHAVPDADWEVARARPHPAETTRRPPA